MLQNNNIACLLPLKISGGWLKEHAKMYHQIAKSTFSNTMESFKVVALSLVKVQYVYVMSKAFII